MKLKDKKSIWQAPIYLPYLQPSLTNDIFQDAEKQLGVILPNEYIDLLKIQNGGYIRYTLKEFPHREIYGIGPYFPSITNVDWSDYKEYVSFKLDGLIPFDGDGHWYICLDYRNNKLNPEVAYIDTELDSEKTIAQSFCDYLSQLVLGVDDELVLETNTPIENVIKDISIILSIEFEEPDSFAHGYPVYRSSYNDSWVWVSPNTVPKGFVRENEMTEEEHRFIELINATKGTTSRYPEIPSSYILVNVSSDEAKNKLVDKLILNQIGIKPLKDYLH